MQLGNFLLSVSTLDLSGFGISDLSLPNLSKQLKSLNLNDNRLASLEALKTNLFPTLVSIC